MSTRLGQHVAGGLVLALAGGVLDAAQGADCLTVAGAGLCMCPVTGVNAYCETTVGAGPGASPICVIGGGGGGGAPDLIVSCVLDRNGGLGGGDIVLILDTVTGDFEASGSDAAGNPFCCKVVANRWAGMGVKLIETNIQGTTHNDISIAHTYTDAGGTPWDLINPAAWLTTHGLVYGNEGNDTIFGSNLGGNAYHEWLNGDEGSDTIRGGDYWDSINGGSGGDFLYGEGAPDTITGGAGDDYIEGGNESCSVGACFGDGIDAGGGADVVFGGTAMDDIHGGAGDDCLDGEDDDDTIAGELDDDAIFGGLGVDTVAGGAGTDAIDTFGDAAVDHVDGGPQDDDYYVDGTDVVVNVETPVTSVVCE